MASGATSGIVFRSSRAAVTTQLSPTSPNSISTRSARRPRLRPRPTAPDNRPSNEEMNRSSFALIALAASLAAASTAAAQDSTYRRLTLGDAVRIASRQNANVEVARLRADEAEARVRQRRADLLPNLTSYIQ